MGNKKISLELFAKIDTKVQNDMASVLHGLTRFLPIECGSIKDAERFYTVL